MQAKQLHKINEKITTKEVRLVGDDVSEGVYPLQDALRLAKEQGLDLVEIVANSFPSICKITDYSKLLYKQKQFDKKTQSESKKTVTKEVRFTINIDEHDLKFKTNHVINFLKKKNRVVTTVFFKGREIQFADKGKLLLLTLSQEVAEYGSPESLPSIEGKVMRMTIAPKSTMKK